MENKETCWGKYKFTIYPCNFEVKIREIKPFYVYAYNYLALNLQVINNSNFSACIKIKSPPKYGNLYLIDAYTLIYKPIIRFYAVDTFQMLIKDEFGGKYVETVFIHIIC